MKKLSPNKALPLISVIIPVYNVEKYIDKCIQSLLDQSYTNFEAIIVDDGSPDNSITIAKDLTQNDPRFLFLKKENGGQSSARNMGLDFMSGEYISFLDPDDYFAPNTFELCSDAFQEDKDLDIILFGINSVDQKGSIYQQSLPSVERYYSEKDILLTNGSIDYSVCNKIFKKNVFENKRFVEGIIYEDKEITPGLLLNKKIASLGRALYFYIYRSGSTMHSYSKISHESFLSIYNRYKKLLDHENIFDEYKEYYEKSVISYCFYSEIIKIMKYSEDFHNDVSSFKQQSPSDIINDNHIKKYFKIYEKQRLIYNVFKVSPNLCRLIIMIYSRSRNLFIKRGNNV